MGGSVALQAGYTWEKLSERYAEPEKRYWEENVSLNTAQGDIYDNRMVDILPGIDGISQFELDDNQRNSFIVRFEDQSGRKFIVGSPQFPLKFKANYNSSRGFYQTEFTGRQLHRALIWNY